MKRDKPVDLVGPTPASGFLGIAVAGMVGLAMVGNAGRTAPPTLTITLGPYHNEQMIIGVGRPEQVLHSLFAYQHHRVCGSRRETKNLPTSVATCDGNTIQGNTILVAADGSFSEHGYQVYALPNVHNSERTQTLCRCAVEKKICVLYIGQNQEKFTAPKMFSPLHGLELEQAFVKDAVESEVT